MSYCEIIAFKDGKPFESEEFKNAWGGAAFIWSAMFDRFLKDPKIEHDNWLTNSARLWTLHKRKDIPRFMRAVHCSTYDRAFIKQADFKQFISDLGEFMYEFGNTSNACHLESWKGFIKKHFDAEGIGFYQTSVAENPWFKWDEEKEESIPYDLKTGDDHFDVYDHLKEWEAYQA